MSNNNNIRPILSTSILCNQQNRRYPFLNQIINISLSQILLYLHVKHVLSLGYCLQTKFSLGSLDYFLGSGEQILIKIIITKKLCFSISVGIIRELVVAKNSLQAAMTRRIIVKLVYVRNIQQLHLLSRCQFQKQIFSSCYQLSILKFRGKSTKQILAVWLQTLSQGQKEQNKECITCRFEHSIYYKLIMEEHTQPAQQPQPVTFKEIAYTQRREINYLDDIAAMGHQYVSFLESLNYNQAPKVDRSAFNSIADDLYKKIVKQGYVDKPSKVAKKNKKGDAEVNFYNTNDSFIDDQECCLEKKEKTSTFEDYCCVQVNSIEELYANPHYKKLREELIVEQGKRKGEQFSLNQIEDKERFDEMRKNIKNIILGRNSRPIVYESEANNNQTNAPVRDNKKEIEIVDEEVQVVQQDKKE